MACVDSQYYNEGGEAEMTELVKEMVDLNEKYKDNKGLKIKNTQRSDEGKCLTHTLDLRDSHAFWHKQVLRDWIFGKAKSRRVFFYWQKLIAMSTPLINHA